MATDTRVRMTLVLGLVAGCLSVGLASAREAGTTTGTQLLQAALVLGAGAMLCDQAYVAADGFNGPMILVQGEGVRIERVRLDGNRANADSSGIEVRGSAEVVDTTVTHCRRYGFIIADGSSSATLRATRCAAVDIAGTGVSLGFRSGPGKLVTRDCRAEGCDYAGFYFGGGTGCVLDGSSTRNGIGACILGSGGTVGRFASFDDNHFGFMMDQGAGGWTCDTIEATATGRTARVPSGTGVELFNHNCRNRFNNIISKSNPGYGLAIANASCDNVFENVLCDATGGWDGDPGLHFSGGSNRNRITSATVIGHSVGCILGENDAGPDQANNDNWIGTLTLKNCTHSALRLAYGTGNHWDRMIVENCGCAIPEYPGAVDFANAVAGNSIVRLEQRGKNLIPPYAVHAAPGTKNNRIESGVVESWKTAPTKDESGQNTFSGIRAAR